MHAPITNHKNNNLLILVGDTRVLYEIILEVRHLEYRRSGFNWFVPIWVNFSPPHTKIPRAMSGLRSKGLTHPSNALVEVIMSLCLAHPILKRHLGPMGWCPGIAAWARQQYPTLGHLGQAVFLGFHPNKPLVH